MKSSNLIAVGIVLIVSLWMLSGMLQGDQQAPQKQPAAVHTLTHVQVQNYQAQPMQREVVIQGQTRANRQVVVKAQSTGQVKQLLMTKGSAVKAGQVVIKLEPDARQLQLEEAQALLAQRTLEFEAAKQLKSKALQTERQLAEAETLLQNARTQLKNAELNKARQNLLAPFDGLIQAQQAELGDYLMIGDPAFTLVSLDPLLIAGDVSENEISRLHAGLDVNIDLSNGTSMSGKLTFIAPLADSNTRTYAIEVEASNPGSVQRGGMSATLRIPLETLPAHKVSPALLSLNDAGVLGLKLVTEEKRVKFQAVEILKSERDGIWLSGLPQNMQLITVGQGFVRDGDQVEIAQAKESN